MLFGQENFFNQWVISLHTVEIYLLPECMYLVRAPPQGYNRRM